VLGERALLRLTADLVGLGEQPMRVARRTQVAAV